MSTSRRNGAVPSTWRRRAEAPRRSRDDKGRFSPEKRPFFFSELSLRDAVDVRRRRIEDIRQEKGERRLFALLGGRVGDQAEHDCALLRVASLEDDDRSVGGLGVDDDAVGGI